MIFYSTDGGSLMLMPRDAAVLWEGAERPTNGRVVHAQSRTTQEVATDYDRACDVRAAAALLPAGQAWVIVVNAEASEAAWLPLSADMTDIALVSVAYWDEEPTAEVVQESYRANATGDWDVLAEALQVGSGGIALMHAATTASGATEYPLDAEVAGNLVFNGDAIVAPLPAGQYRADVRKVVRRATADEPGQFTVLVRFRREGASQ